MFPEAPSSSNPFPDPEHFLSQVALDLGLNLFPAAIRVNVHVHFFLPSFTFSFLNTSGPAARLVGLSTGPITKDSKKSGTHWHPAGPPAILFWTDLVPSIPFGQTFSIS